MEQRLRSQRDIRRSAQVLRGAIGLSFVLSASCKSGADSGGNPAAPTPTSYYQGAVGSGGGYPQPTYPNQSVATIDPNSGCSAGGCQKAMIEVSINGNPNRRLDVQRGGQINWAFTARSTNYPSRQLMVFRVVATPQPATLSITGNGTGNVAATWNPQQTDPAVGDIQVSVRDLTACQATNTTGNATNCQDYNTVNPAFDDMQSFQWNLPGGSGSIGGIGGSSGGNNAVLAAGLGALIGILQGQSLPGALANGLGAALGTLLGGGLGNGIAYPNGVGSGTYPNGALGGQNCAAYTVAYICQNAGCVWNYNQCFPPGGLYPNGIPNAYPTYNPFNPYPNGNSGVAGDPYNCAQWRQQYQCQPPNCIWNGYQCYPTNGSAGFYPTPTSNPQCLSIQTQTLCQQTIGCTWTGLSCR